MLGRARVGVRQQEHVVRMVGIGGEHLGSVDHPAVTVAHRAGLAGRDVGTALGFGEPQAQSVVPGQRLGQHLVAQLGRAEIVDGVRHHRCRAPMEPRRVGPPYLELPDPALDRAEPALALREPIPLEISRGAEGQVDALVEVVPRLAIAADHVGGDHIGEESAQFGLEQPILVAEHYFGEVPRYPPSPAAPNRSVTSTR